MCKLSAYEMTRDRKMVVVLADSYIPQHSIKVFDLRSLLYSTNLCSDLACSGSGSIL